MIIKADENVRLALSVHDCGYIFSIKQSAIFPFFLARQYRLLIQLLRAGSSTNYAQAPESNFLYLFSFKQRRCQTNLFIKKLIFEINKISRLFAGRVSLNTDSSQPGVVFLIVALNN